MTMCNMSRDEYMANVVRALDMESNQNNFEIKNLNKYVLFFLY